MDKRAVYCMNLRDNREGHADTASHEKFQFCLQQQVVGIGWVNGDEHSEPEFQRAKTYMSVLHTGDLVWIKEPDAEQYYIAEIMDGCPEVSADGEFARHDLGYCRNCKYYRVGTKDDIPSEYLESLKRLTAPQTIQPRTDIDLIDMVNDLWANAKKAQDASSFTKNVRKTDAERPRIKSILSFIILVLLLLPFFLIEEEEVFFALSIVVLVLVGILYFYFLVTKIIRCVKRKKVRSSSSYGKVKSILLVGFVIAYDCFKLLNEAFVYRFIGDMMIPYCIAAYAFLLFDMIVYNRKQIMKYKAAPVSAVAFAGGLVFGKSSIVMIAVEGLLSAAAFIILYFVQNKWKKNGTHPFGKKAFLLSVSVSAAVFLLFTGFGIASAAKINSETKKIQEKVAGRIFVADSNDAFPYSRIHSYVFDQAGKYTLFEEDGSNFHDGSVYIDFDGFGFGNAYCVGKRIVYNNSGEIVALIDRIDSTEKYSLSDEAFHNYVKEIITEATCTSSGRARFVCSNCGNEYEEPIPKTEHDYVDGYCRMCGQKKVDRVDMEPNCWYTHAGYEFLRFQNCLIVNAFWLDPYLSYTVSFYPVCAHCHAVITDIFQTASPGYNDPVIKSYHCNECGETTFVQFQVSIG